MRKFSRREALTLAAFGSTAAHAALGPRGYEVTFPELFVDDLDPAHDGLRIAQISDIHVGMNTPEARVRDAISEINALRPDLVFLTGDFVTYSKQPLPLVSSLMNGLDAPTFAVLGNHDHFVDPRAVTLALEGSGYATLRNQHTVVRIKGAPLTIFGVDDGGTRNDDVAMTFNAQRPRGPASCSPTTPRPLESSLAQRAWSVFQVTRTAGRSSFPRSPTRS